MNWSRVAELFWAWMWAVNVSIVILDLNWIIFMQADGLVWLSLGLSVLVVVTGFRTFLRIMSPDR